MGALGKRHSGNGRQTVLGIQNGPLTKACLVPVLQTVRRLRIGLPRDQQLKIKKKSFPVTFIQR